MFLALPTAFTVQVTVTLSLERQIHVLMFQVLLSDVSASLFIIAHGTVRILQNVLRKPRQSKIGEI
jgi:hypothetical protein